MIIVGSGYTGLNAAIQTARGGRSTLVLDKETIGWGCSSRNGGHVSNSLKPEFAPLAKRIGAEAAKGVLQEGLNALQYIDDLVKQENLDIDWKRCGRFYGAHNPRQFKLMVEHKAQTDELDYLKLPYFIVDPKDTPYRKLALIFIMVARFILMSDHYIQASIRWNYYA